MSTFVKSFVDGCAMCQAMKIKPRTKVPLQPNPIPTSVWETITMDFITNLPMSLGYDALFVVIDCFSKATIISPCNKTITADETAKLYLENTWQRTGLLRQVISDRGPQFTSRVMQEVWSKVGVKSTLSTAFHLQTDGETERVNQELEQYLHIFCNFQQDNWAELIPFMEFMHNVRQHSATKKSPFEVWYGYKPEFIPPIHFTTRILAAKERLNTLNQICSEITSALKVAAEVIRNSKSPTMFQEFKIGDLVWLEGTTIHTTHPKAKLAPR